MIQKEQLIRAVDCIFCNMLQHHYHLL